MLNSLNIEVLSEDKARMLSAVNLAFVGDAVFDIFVRAQLILLVGDWGINEINRLKVGIVKASQQARIAREVIPLLSEVELGILKRGRNLKTQSVPKNALLADYRYATGFEALLGYLALSGRGDRLQEILSFAWQLCAGDGLLVAKPSLKSR